MPWSEFARELDAPGVEEPSSMLALDLLQDASVGITSGGNLPAENRLVSMTDDVFEYPTVLLAIRRAIDIHFSRTPPDAVAAAAVPAISGLNEYQLRRLSLSPLSLAEAGKAAARLDSDPAAAVTSSRALLEATFKWIAHEAGIPLDSGLSLNQMLRECKRALALDQAHAADLSRALIRICDILGVLRNDLSDAHGRRPGERRATVGEAHLAVSSSMATAAYLLDRFEAAVQMRTSPTHCES